MCSEQDGVRRPRAVFGAEVPARDRERIARPAAQSRAPSPEEILRTSAPIGLLWVLAIALKLTIPEDTQATFLNLVRACLPIFEVVLAAVTALPVLTLAVSTLGHGVGRAVRRDRDQAVERWQGRFVLPDALDETCGRLLARFQLAATAIAESNAATSGLLDSVASRAVLEEQEFALAQRLVQISELRHDGVPADAAPGGHAAALAAGQRRVLEAVLDSIDGRVRHLESFAESVADLDAKLDDARLVQELHARQDRILDVVAATAGDQVDDAGVDRLAEAVPAAARTLTEQVEAVRAEGEAFLAGLRDDPALTALAKAAGTAAVVPVPQP